MIPKKNKARYIKNKIKNLLLFCISERLFSLMKLFIDMLTSEYIMVTSSITIINITTPILKHLLLNEQLIYNNNYKFF